MFRKAYTGQAKPRVNHELEKALKKIESLEYKERNLADIEMALDYEVIQALADIGLARYVSIPDERGYGDYARIERTLDGRNYFSEKRRWQIERYGPQVVGGLIAISGTVVGVVLGSWLSVAHPFG